MERWGYFILVYSKTGTFKIKGMKTKEVKTNKAPEVIHRDITAFSPSNKEGVITVDFYYSKIHCNGCKRVHHGTCENCGFHGVFNEFGEDFTCPECNWGGPT